MPPSKQDKKSKSDKKQTKKDETKKSDRPDDFQYIVRIANTDINGDYTLVYGLSQIKGIGRRLAYLIADTVDIPRNNKMGTLKDTEVEKIREALTRVEEIAPPWMLNHRNEYDSGEDIHLISTQVDLRLRDDINLLKMIRSYRGIRHEFGLPVRGQRTRANNRTGLSLGVSKKKP
ncbi:MAG: 30S ribosomal protein S13 [Candidatus Thermoplasmatota archaeon]|nr:30S ribosomal protein S13 [Candidatus Thermoplasmatota archaeon]MBU1941622.1 30S ribosomal protein S13 [Candidatus Thermoplasmatota archaeon]